MQRYCYSLAKRSMSPEKSTPTKVSSVDSMFLALTVLEYSTSSKLPILGYPPNRTEGLCSRKSACTILHESCARHRSASPTTLAARGRPSHRVAPHRHALP